MDRFVNNNDFNKDVIYEKLADLSSKIEEEMGKDDNERSIERERELMFALMFEGIKLNTLSVKNDFYLR